MLVAGLVYGRCMAFRRGLGAVLIAASCGPSSRELQPDAVTDAATDAAPQPEYLPEPFEITGSTPAGPLDLHYIHARYASTWCGEQYEIELSRTTLYDNFTTDPLLYIRFAMPREATEPLVGDQPATAQLTTWTHELADTSQVVFVADRVDPPMMPGGRIIGHVVVNDPGWSLDFRVDLPRLFSIWCF